MRRAINQIGRSFNLLQERSSLTVAGSSSTWWEENAEGWLQRTPEEWPQNPDYIFMSEVARYKLAVNDCAERNTKAITDYIHFTRDVNGMLDNIVLVGEDRCSLIPNLSRENLLHA